ncbi:hypothetical protein GPALN_013290 [Globodera pallida]|nr:hypothetical protein GPALN_013290 [Globodera pallida]
MSDNSSSDLEFVDLLNTGLTNTAFKQFTFVCLIISGTLNMRLLLLARFRPAVLHVPELSRALVVYLCFHCAGAILSLPYTAYVLINFYYGTNDWHTPSTIYTIFFSGQWLITYTAISPLVVLFLTMERCFIIKLATNPAKRERIERWMCRASIATLLAAFSVSTGHLHGRTAVGHRQLYVLFIKCLNIGLYFRHDASEEPGPSVKLSNCESVSCLVVKWRNLPQMFFKGSVSFLNIFCCFYFLYTLRTFSAMKNLKNHLVIVTLCFAFCFDFVPAIVSIGFCIFGLGLISNVASTCTALDACCCAIFYSLVFVPPSWLKRANASVSSTNEPKPSSSLQPPRQQQMRSFSLKPILTCLNFNIFGEMFDNASSYMNFVDLLNTGLTNAVFKQFTFVCLIISGTLNMRLLLLARFRPAVLRVPELSRALVVYLCFHCAGAILSLPYNAYVLIRFFYGNDDWRTPRSAYTLFCLGHWQNTYTAISPLAVLFLTMERCFIIKLATNPAKRERIERWLCRASIATLLAAFSASTGIYMSELPLDIDNLKLSNCESVSCLMVKWRNLPQMFFKGSVSFLNIFCCFYFLYTLRTFSAMKNLFGLGLISNVASTCTALDVCCCAIFYSLVFVPPRCLKRANASVGSTNEPKPSSSLQPPQQQQPTNAII